MPIEVELPKSKEQKEKVAATTLEGINKQFGKGTLQKLDPSAKLQRVPSISSGIVGVDNYVIGIGGVPRGRIIEMVGVEAGGKTTLALNFVASAQKSGGLAAFIDAEHGLNLTWAEKNGVNTSELYVNQPSSGEEALEITELLVASGAFDIIVVDSVAALVPQAELDGDMGQSFMGLQARLMSQACRKLTGIISKTGTCVIFINQIREKIGVTYGSNESNPGGRALKFYASLRLDIRRIGAVKSGEDIVGSRTRVKAVKNRLAPPFREVELDLMYEYGFDAIGNLIDCSIEAGTLTKSGAWYMFGTDKFQGKENFRKFLSENTEAYKKVNEDFMKKVYE